MYKLNVTTVISAAHKLNNYLGNCSNLHGHNFKIRISILATELDSCGMAIDFSLVKKKLSQIVEKLDHAYLNELDWFSNINPTSENIAKIIYIEMSKLVNSDKIKMDEVEVWESDFNSVVYTA
jgi:6-pyruvoyltetrahydropterin/6-carboxytetrahydropterin synthase